MKPFAELWQHVQERRAGLPTIQEYTELEHIYNLMGGCSSYLEVGSAEGDSLYVLGNAVTNGGTIVYIDLGEPHTKEKRDEVIQELKANHNVGEYLGDSTVPTTYRPKDVQVYDCVLIDGGHDFPTVLSDAILYAPLAKKYVFFHDIQLPAVKAAVEWFVKRWPLGKYRTFINSETFGYGIIEVGK